MQEFSKSGFAGARVDGIARRAKVNKRMLYHYFTDKEGLFRAVLRQKISERMSRIEMQSPESDIVSNLTLWFKQNCLDTDWVRLLAWESLQTGDGVMLDEKERRRISAQVTTRIKQRQAAGFLRKDVAAVHLHLAIASLALLPMAMPQISRLVIGRSPHDAKFQREYTRFLETISAAFRPSTVARK